MRPVLSFGLFSLLALAACGNRGFELPDGSFDRAGFRSLGFESCSLGMRSGDPSIPSETREGFCNCLMDRLLENSDDELRAAVRDSAVRERQQSEAGSRCMGPAPPVFDPATGRWSDPAGGPAAPSPDDEPPPPEEPPPSFGSSELPPPVVQPVEGDGAE
jgi:hypothetical protein